MARDMQVSFAVAETPGLRNELGRFTSEGVQELQNRNRALGEVLRSQLGRRMENRIAFGKRASASSGRLVAVTVSPRNQHLTRWSVGVGDIDYLNKSTAKYWRTFEEGSAAVWRHPFIGTHLVARYRSPFTRGVPSPHSTSLFTAKGTVGFKNGRADDMFVVKQEIAPAHIYSEVAREANLRVEGLQSARRFLDRIFNTPVKSFPTRT